MKKIATTLTMAMLAIFLLWGTSVAAISNITINDQEPVLGPPPQDIPANENNEVEVGMEPGQKWDLEAIYYDDATNKLTLVGGWNFKDGEGGINSGDIFLSVDNGMPVYGAAATAASGGWSEDNDTIKNIFGYDYVIDFDRTNGNLTGGYQILAINEDSLVKDTDYEANDNSDPWKYYSGGSQVGDDGIYGTAEFREYSNLDGLASEFPGLLTTDHDYVVGEGSSYNVNKWYAMTVDLGSLDVQLTDTWVHFTQECGNDNIMGRISAGGGNAVPEPATLFLLGTGLLGIAGIRRRGLGSRG